jgi:hypothetical protein
MESWQRSLVSYEHAFGVGDVEAIPFARGEERID